MTTKTQTTEFTLSKLKFSKKNPRTIDQDDLDRLKEKLTKYPKFLKLRPIVYDPSTMEVLGGNQRLRALKELGFKKIPKEWIKSAADLSPEEKDAFMIIDNVSDGEWELEILKENWDEDDLNDWGLDLDSDWADDHEDYEATDKEENEMKSKLIKAPTYEPRDEKPEEEALLDEIKFDDLIAKIKLSGASKGEKEFLMKAAARHRVFNYEAIADYYAHSSKEVQELMEDSALVVIDMEKAIENGFVVLTNKIKELYNEDHGNEEKK